MYQDTDFLVIGTGLAGLSFALRVAQYGKVTRLQKVPSMKQIALCTGE